MCFSEEAVWAQVTESGFVQQVFVMYHSTKTAKAAESILTGGFNTSKARESMLGAGVYVSKTREKALPYGPITFKMLVYPGRVCKVTCQGHPMQKAWHGAFGAAWVPPGCGMVDSDLEETCVKSADQVHILGICRGWSLMRKQNLARNLEYREDNKLDLEEEREMTAFLSRLGLLYSKLLNTSCGRYMSDQSHPSGGPTWSRRESDQDQFFWTRTWDNCLENKATGRVLTFRDGCLKMLEYDEDGPDGRNQKWRLDPVGALLLKSFKKPLVVSVVNSSVQVTLGSKAPGGKFDVFQFCSPQTPVTRNALYEDDDGWSSSEEDFSVLF